MYLDRHFFDDGSDQLGALCPTLQLRPQILACHPSDEQLVHNGLDTLLCRGMALRTDFHVVLPPRHSGSRAAWDGGGRGGLSLDLGIGKSKMELRDFLVDK